MMMSLAAANSFFSPKKIICDFGPQKIIQSIERKRCCVLQSECDSETQELFEYEVFEDYMLRRKTMITPQRHMR